MINKPADLSSLDKNQLPVVNSMFSALFDNAMSVTHTDVLPTAKTVAEGQAVIYDNGSGTKRIYFKTQKKNVGYITLT